MRFRDPLQTVISDPNDARLEFVQNFEIMCFKMAGKQGNRVRQLPKDSNPQCLYGNLINVEG